MKAMKNLKTKDPRRVYLRPSADVVNLQVEGVVCQSGLGEDPGEGSFPVMTQPFDSIL